MCKNLRTTRLGQNLMVLIKKSVYSESPLSSAEASKEREKKGERKTEKNRARGHLPRDLRVLSPESSNIFVHFLIKARGFAQLLTSMRQSFSDMEPLQFYTWNHVIRLSGNAHPAFAWKRGRNQVFTVFYLCTQVYSLYSLQ